MDVVHNLEVDGQLAEPSKMEEKETRGLSSDGEGKEDFNDGTKEHPFSKKTWREDLTLVVEGKNLHVSKAMFGLVCRRFSEMFDEGPIETLTISDQTFDSVLEFLKCIYPNIRKQITTENVCLVMPVALEYQAYQLIADCEKCIKMYVHKDTPCSLLMCLLKCCRKNNLKNLEESFWAIIRKMDVCNIEKLETEDADENIARKIADIKIKALKTSVSDYAKKITAVTEERDSLNDALQYMLLGTDDEERSQMESVAGGDLGKVLLHFSLTSDFKPVQQTNGMYTFSIDLNCEGLFVSVTCSQGYRDGLIIKGRIVLVNRVIRRRSKIVPFYQQLPANRICIGQRSGKTRSFRTHVFNTQTLRNDRSGLLIQSEGEIEVQYISKRKV